MCSTHGRVIIILLPKLETETSHDSPFSHTYSSTSVSDNLGFWLKAIIAYLISKLPQIIKNGYKLEIPESCDAALDAFKVQNSLPLQFFQEFCQIRPNRSSTSDGCTRQKIYDAFRNWITTTKPSRRTPERDDFINEIANFVGINPHTMEFRTSSGRYWMITIKPEFWNKGNIFAD